MMKAVKAGYKFNLFPEKDLTHIDLETTGRNVKVKGIVYPLYGCTTFEESKKVDNLLDRYGEKSISSHIVNKERSKEPER